MFIRLFLISLLILSLPGCATHKKVSKQDQIKALEAQVSDLQSELDSKDQEIQSVERKTSTGYAKKTRSSVVTKSSKLTNVEIQTALKNAGFYEGAIDGKVGKLTKKAIKDFQAANGLTADGIVGKKTAAALKQHLKESIK